MPNTCRTPSRASMRTTHSPPVGELIELRGGPRHGPPPPPTFVASRVNRGAPRVRASSLSYVGGPHQAPPPPPPPSPPPRNVGPPRDAAAPPPVGAGAGGGGAGGGGGGGSEGG